MWLIGTGYLRESKFSFTKNLQNKTNKTDGLKLRSYSRKTIQYSVGGQTTENKLF